MGEAVYNFHCSISLYLLYIFLFILFRIIFFRIIYLFFWVFYESRKFWFWFFVLFFIFFVWFICDSQELCHFYPNSEILSDVSFFRKILKPIFNPISSKWK